MQDEIKAGTILVKEGLSFPDALKIESKAYLPGWRSVTDLDGYALDRKAHEVGWTFFYLAGENRSSVFGSEGQETVRKAIKRVLADLKLEQFNSVEITRIAFKHFLGLPYATVSFHLRNMQESMYLVGGDNARAWQDVPLVTA